MINRTRLGGAVVATLVGLAAAVVATSGPAAASGACAKGTGVTVVVGSSVSCDANGGSPASNNFGDAGHSLTYVNDSSFVCKVDGGPSSAVCARTPPSNAYWGLFWSNGTSGTWTYASSGVASLKVPTGGWVAFVFQNSSSRTPPGVTPLAAAPPAQPKPKPSTSSGPSGGGHGGSSRGATPSATPTDKSSAGTKSPTDKKSSPSSSATPTDGATVTTQPGDDLTKASQDTGGSSPLGWIAGALAILLLAGMAAVLWRRRIAGGRTP